MRGITFFNAIARMTYRGMFQRFLEKHSFVGILCATFRIELLHDRRASRVQYRNILVLAATHYMVRRFNL